MALPLTAERICLITGASGGLGRHLVSRFWDSGFSLCLVARSNNALEEIEASLPGRKDQRVTLLDCDLGNASSVAELAQRARQCLPRLDVLINNAATHGPIAPLWQCDIDEWQRALQINLLAPVTLCHAFVPWMSESGGGSIVNLSGGGATGPRAKFSAYATSKAGLVRFSETLAEETRPCRIRVNCVAPGPMKTNLLAEVMTRGADAVGEHEYRSAKRTFEEGGSPMVTVAELVLFLASSASDGITGKLISAMWDPWAALQEHRDDLDGSDIYTLRRIVPKDRGKTWGDDR